MEAEPELGGAIQLEKPLLLCEEGCDWGRAGWALLPVFCGSPRKAGLPIPGVSLSRERQGLGSNTEPLVPSRANDGESRQGGGREENTEWEP